jgi:hypothetical protein
MNSKNKKPPTVAEKAHIERIKSMACVICNAPPPSDCHEPEQGLWFASIPLCRDCHMGSHNGIHGRKAIWNVMKMDELRALALTVERMVA